MIQVHVCCMSEHSSRSPITLAIELNKPDVVKRLIEIVIQQYTPLIKESKKDEKVPLINNYELVNLMRNYTVFNLFISFIIDLPAAWKFLGQI
jgi:hypothetical protein